MNQLKNNLVLSNLKVKITIELTRVAKKSLSLLINFEDMLVFAELIRESFPSLST